ncbi:MAG: dUTP diphosphatase [Bacilli bacterium]|nr:dUTP diphosphatase [Bacilli bacterium]
MKLKIINTSGYPNPDYNGEGNSGMDIRTCIKEPVTLNSLERKLFPTGIKIEIPIGYEIQVRPRSGLALKKGITVLNTPGTIDASYQGEIGIVLVNLSKEPVTINPGDRIAQLVLSKVEISEGFEEIEFFEQTTARGEGGYGSTGIQ